MWLDPKFAIRRTFSKRVTIAYSPCIAVPVLNNKYFFIKRIGNKKVSKKSKKKKKWEEWPNHTPAQRRKLPQPRKPALA
jgi:hypothetical protein